MRPLHLSIVMPVFNTGSLLLESVRSVVQQTLFAEDQASWELLIIDDASDDFSTLAALKEACGLSPCVQVMPNRRSRGAAGARNTGIDAARGAWVAFLDSDDLWYPDFLCKQFALFDGLPDARWRAAHFDVGDGDARAVAAPLSTRSPCLYAYVAADYEAGRPSVLRRPVDVLLRCGCIQVMTVQIDRELILSLGGFREDFVCAEDYDLWVRLANVEDLHLSPLDAGIYRVRRGSLTKSGRPMYYGEDRMLLSARADRRFAAHVRVIDERLRKVYSKFCFHFREHRAFGEAISFAIRLIRLSPLRPDGWKHLVAATLRR